MLLLLLTIEVVVGTVGWRRMVRQRSPQAVYRYFVLQFALITLLLAFEWAVGVKGLSTSMLGIGLMFQGSVLPTRTRVWLFAGLLLVVVALYAQSMQVWFPDVERIALFVLLFAAVYSVGLLLGLLIVREERARETSLRLDESNRKLAHYAAEVGDLSTFQERNRLAREIHDTLGHYLTAINIQLEVALTSVAQDNEPARTALFKAQSLTKEALSEIRRSISGLRATPLENRALDEAIALLAEEHRAAGNNLNFRVIGTMRACSPAVEMAFYRIAQEGLTNIRKHSQSDSADLILNYGETATVTLEVRDNGIGSDDSTGGFGLLGIGERVQLLGGSLTVKTAKGRGFTLRAVIPG
jgi:signal transduction histidine kinase